MCGWFYPSNSFFGGGSLFFMLPMLIFWGVLICGAVILIRRLCSAPAPCPPNNADAAFSALKILNERYAKGEIDQAEYERIRTDLIKSRNPEAKS